MHAAMHGKARAVSLLLDKEGQIYTPEGKTAMMFAAQKGYLKCVQELLHAEQGQRDMDGHTALWYAKNGRD